MDALTFSCNRWLTLRIVLCAMFFAAFCRDRMDASDLTAALDDYRQHLRHTSLNTIQQPPICNVCHVDTWLADLFAHLQGPYGCL
jgi:hypothetical protein